MGVAGEVVENMFGAAERRLGVDDPVLLAELPEEVAERVRRGKLLKRAVKLKLVLREELSQSGDELAAEHAAQCLDGQEKAARGIYPSGAVGSQPSSGNDVVDVGMMLEVHGTAGPPRAGAGLGDSGLDGRPRRARRAGGFL